MYTDDNGPFNVKIEVENTREMQALFEGYSGKL